MEVCPGNLQRRHRRPALRVEIRLEDGISRQNQRYARSRTVLSRLARNYAAMRFDNLPAKIKPDTGTPSSALLADGMLFHTKEFVEDSLAKSGAELRIRYPSRRFAAAPFRPFPVFCMDASDRNRAAARRVLESVAQKIGEDHRQSGGVATQEAETARCRRRAALFQHPRIADVRTSPRDRLRFVKIDALACQAKLSRLDPGQIQQLIDSARQFVASQDGRGENLVLPRSVRFSAISPSKSGSYARWSGAS